MGTLRIRLLSDQRGFTGAEKALLICFGLAIIVLVGALLSSGSQKAGNDAQKILAQGLGASAQLGQIMAPGAMPQAGDVVPPRPAAPAPAPGPTPLANGMKDTAYDGAPVGAGGQAYPPGTPLSQIPPFVPSNGTPPVGNIVYVNGINTTKDDQATSLQLIADRTGANVVGIHNATAGTIKDLAQSLGDKANLGNNPAVTQLSDAIYNSIKAGQPIHIMAHSQGGLITSRALGDVARRLRIEDGMSQAQAQQALGLVKVETFGAAAMTYPNGPQYIHYINRFDPVPTEFGLGATRLGNWGAGQGAQVVRFNDPHWNPIASHSFNDVYLPRRQPF